MLRCHSEDLGSVSLWFPRAGVESLDEQTPELRFWYRNEEALVSRIIGLAGTAWVVEPASAVAGIRMQVEAVLGTDS